MDIKSILRAFRYGELQSKADRDPTQKRPPTIMFMGLAIVLGIVALAIGFVVSQPTADTDGRSLTVTDPPLGTNATTTPSTGPEDAERPAIAPERAPVARDDWRATSGQHSPTPSQTR